MKRILSLLLVLCLVFPVLAFAELDEEELDMEDLDLDEDYEYDAEGNLILKDDETGETFELAGISEEDIESLASQYELDDSIDPNELELNENLPDNIINILLIGLDVKGTKEKKLLTEQSEYAKRSDVLMILSLNTSDGSIKLSSIARNTFVEVPGRKNKTIIANSYGHANYDSNGKYASWTDTPETCMATVNRNFELNIQYYIALNFYGVVQIIEGLGGVDIDLTKTEATAINTYLSMSTIKNSKGEKISHGRAIANTYDDKNGKRDKLKKQSGVQQLDGLQALMYARLRSIDSDWVRITRQRRVIQACMDSIKGSDLATLNKLADAVLPMISTNFTQTELLSLMTKAPKFMGVKFNQMTIPVQGSYGGMMVMGGRGAFAPDFEKNSQILKEFIYENKKP